MSNATHINAEQICLELLHADNEDLVLGILARYGLDDEAYWQPLGGIANNLSIVNNQQSSAVTALTEKLINSVDSLLLLECRLRGIDPESSAAPRRMVDAAELFFGIPGGDIARLKPADRARLAERVQLTATGSRSSPCYTLLDTGEGQRPADFPTTFLSLVRSNKLMTHFVQGKFCMGGSGVLPFCGRRNIQLIIARRHPQLVQGGDDPQDGGWGWTIVRRRDPQNGARSSSYEYLAPGGVVPSFLAPSLPLRPTRTAAYGGPLEWGSVIKLYNYRIECPSAIVFDLNYELSRRLYQIAVPVRLCERRDYQGHSRETILTGMSVRVADDRAGILEPGFPDSGVMYADNGGDIPVEVIAFQAGKGRSFLTPQAAIFLTVNGQVHGTLPRRFLTREAVKLDFIKNDVMVVLNCTGLPDRVREELFMASRDRLRDGLVQRGIEEALETFLAEHVELQHLNRQRRDEELRGRLANDQPLTDALKNVIQSSPELRSLFGHGENLPVEDEPGDRRVPFNGLRFPTFFNLHTQPAPGEVTVIKCPINATARVRFDTDAANDYFQRRDEPGSITMVPPDVFSRVFLHDGKAMLVLRCPPPAAVGDTIDFTMAVTDRTRTHPFLHRLRLQVMPPTHPTERTPSPDRPQSGALALPAVVEVFETDWEAEGFGPESGLTVLRDVDRGLVAKINMDNRYLKSTLARTPAADRDLVRKRFVYGLVLAGVSLWQEYKDHSESDELIRSSSKAIARILLPTITVLGALEPTPQQADT